MVTLGAATTTRGVERVTFFGRYNRITVAVHPETTGTHQGRAVRTTQHMNPIGEFLRLKGLALQRSALPGFRHLAAYRLKAIVGCEGAILIHITNLIIAVYRLLLTAGHAQDEAQGVEMAEEQTHG
jgi:hypothetical protein